MVKKDAYYFSHDSNAQDDPKCMMLIDDLGMEGYGIFWALIEKLRAEKDYSLPISICGRFARRWATSEAKIQAVVMQYGLFEISEDRFFSIRLKRSMDERSEKARLSVSKRWSKNQQLTCENTYERNTNVYDSNTTDIRNDTIKVKESKGKERKEEFTAEKSATKKSIEERKEDFYSSLLGYMGEYSKDTLRAFFDYWSEHNENGKKMKFEMQKTFSIKNRLEYWERNSYSKKRTESDDVKVATEANFYN